jgi:ABC-type sugar transport system ATPase subunit
LVREAAVRDAAGLLGLTELLDRLPAELSGGQRQRVAMGRAIVRQPAVFLFDEPLSNLDASLRQHMRVELKRLHKQIGATIVHVTHDQVEALTLADRIMVLDQGVVQQMGTPRELFDRPANTFVAQFIGAPSMTILPAEGKGATSLVEGLEQEIEVSGEGPYLMGIRPTDLGLQPVDHGPCAVIDLVESHGATALLHLVWGPHRLMAQVAEPTEFEPGDEVGLVFRKVHRFDEQTGERI